MKNNLLLTSNSKLYWGIIVILSILYIRGLFSAIYGIDATIYASLSSEMVDTNNWLQIFHKGNDYLDKPPLHFWLSAISFKLFGVNSFAYKLPSFLFTVLGAYSTFKLATILYSKQVGKLAALFFYSCFSIVLINQDVRTDTILVGIVIFSLWNLISYVETSNKLSFVLGFIGIGLAMLAKGPIGLMVPVLSLGIHFLIKKQWSNIFKWQWIIGLLITAVVISPMVWGLYQQFDLQPTKAFNLASGKDGTGTSGLKFYFWDQSFGRITGGNKEWVNDSSIFFFVHTFLWSFLPWSVFAIIGLFKKSKLAFQNISNHEFYTLGAVIIPFIAFSISQFQLPHYIYVFFPMFFILTGWYIFNVKENSIEYKILRIIHLILNLSLISASIIAVTYIFPTKSMFILLPMVVFIGVISYLYFKTKGKNQLVLTTITAFVSVVFVFNFHFMPKNLEYDGLVKAAKTSNDFKVNKIFSNTASSLAFDIYGASKVTYKNIYELHEYTNQNNYIFIPAFDFENVSNAYDLKSFHKFSHHSVTHLTIDFINPKTRENTLEYYYLVEI
ncbi:MAG: ArnT family glycosyltransferase [Flavobacteriales bacterium]